MKHKIGVIGSAVSSDEAVLAKARELGQEIAKRGCVLLSGGTTGLPYETVKGAREYNGLTIGVSPAHNLQEHVEKYKLPTEFDVLLYTGFGFKGRNVPMVRSCDGVVAISGRIGTLNELTIAYDEKKVIGILEGSGGVCDKFKGILDDCGKVGGIVIYDSNPTELIDKILLEL